MYIGAAVILSFFISAAPNTILLQENLKMIISTKGGSTYDHFRKKISALTFPAKGDYNTIEK